jgi:hypothetical protein
MPLPHRRSFEGRRVAAAMLVSVTALCCAAVPRTAMPVPTAAAAPPASSGQAQPLAPPSTIEADFIVDSSTTVKASLEDVHAMLMTEGSLTHVLPYTRSADLVGTAQGPERHVRLVQGTSLINVEYTLHIEDAGAVVRFHLVKRFPHGIEDSQGFFELTAEAPDRTRVRFVDAVDLGGGIARLLFKEQIRKSALTTPLLVRNYMESGKPAHAPPPNGVDLAQLGALTPSPSPRAGEGSQPELVCRPSSFAAPPETRDKGERAPLSSPLPLGERGRG